MTEDKDDHEAQVDEYLRVFGVRNGASVYAARTVLMSIANGSMVRGARVAVQLQLASAKKETP